MSDHNSTDGNIIDIRDPDKSHSNTIAILEAFLDRLHTQEEFRVGDIVKWKNGLKNRNSPDYGEPAIILTVLEDPFYNERSHLYSNYYYDPLTIVIGYLEDNELKASHVDSKKFTRF